MSKPALEPAIRSKLAAYRTAVRRHVLYEGVAWTVAAVVGLSFLSLAIDYWQRLGTPARGFALAVGLAGLGWLVVRMLVSPLRRPMDEERIALTVEERYPQLRDRLISALQFAPRLEGDAGDYSVPMMASVAADAARAFAPLPLAETLDRRRVLRAVGIALAACALFACVGFLSDEGQNVLGLWARRNLLLMNVRWPQRTHLRVECPAVVPRGDPLTIEILASGDVPSTATIRYRFEASGKRGEDELARLAGEERNRFRARFKNVVESLTFRVRGGDAETDPITVGLVERPKVTHLKFRAIYPHYTRRPSEMLAAGTSFLQVLPGTRVTVAAGCDKALRDARLVSDDNPDGFPMAVAAPDHKARSWFSGSELDAVRDLRVAELEARVDGAITVRVTDTAGLANKPAERFVIRIRKDRVPVVTLRTDGVGDMVVPAARVPLVITATDDFGVAGLLLRHRFSLEDKVSDEEAIPYETLPFGDRKIAHRITWEIASLGLQPGCVLTFHAEATDAMEPRANVGKAEALSLRIVTADELLAELTRRQVELRQDFVRVRDRQIQEVGIELAAARRAVQRKPSLSEEQVTRLEGIERTLRQSAEESRHVAAMFDRVLAELNNNGLADDRERKRLGDGIITPLRDVATVAMPDLADGVGAAPRLNAAELEQGVAALVGRDEDIRKVMDRVLTNMIKMETFLRIVDTLRKLKHEQQDVVAEIEKERKRLLESLLNKP